MDSDTASKEPTLDDRLDAKSIQILDMADKAAAENRLAPAQVMVSFVIAGELIQIRRALQTIAARYKSLQ